MEVKKKQDFEKSDIKEKAAILNRRFGTTLKKQKPFCEERFPRPEGQR